MPDTQWQGNRRTEALTWGQDLLQSSIPGAINFSCRWPPCVRSLYVGKHSHNQWTRAVTSYIWATPYDVFAPQEIFHSLIELKGDCNFLRYRVMYSKKESFWTWQKQTRHKTAQIFTSRHINRRGSVNKERILLVFHFRTVIPAQ